MEKQISLWAYSRGEAARDLPWIIWRMVEDAGDWDKLVHWNPPEEDSRVPVRGDLIEFIEWMKGKLFVLAVNNATGDIVGFGWYSDIRNGTALTSIWVNPLHRGKFSREITFAGIKFGYEMLGLETLQTMTPWPIARNLARKCGFKDIAFIPKHFGIDTWLLEHKKEKTSQPSPPAPGTLGGEKGTPHGRKSTKTEN